MEKSLAALDINPWGYRDLREETQGAQKASVHAQDARNLSVVFRVEAGAAANRRQRQPQSEHSA